MAASLLEVMNKNKTLSGIRMGYETKGYNEALEKLYNDVKTTRDNSGGNGVLNGAYIPSSGEMVDTTFDLTRVGFNEKGFSIGDDEDKKLASLSFVPNRGFVTIKKSENKYSMIKMSDTVDRRFEHGISTCGRYVSPPVSLNREIIEAGESNTEEGRYRVGCCIDATGMLKDYFIHFYPNDAIGRGLKNGSIRVGALENLIAERCLYAEVSFGAVSKTSFMSVTDSYKSGGLNDLYIRIDAPLCTTSSLSSVFNIQLDNNHESIHLSSTYDFKKGSLSFCDSRKYMDCARNYSNQTMLGKISLANPSKLGVRFFSLPEKKTVVESIVGPMPDEFYKTNSDFKIDMSNTVVYSGVEFIKGDVMQAREKFYEERGPVPEEVLQRLRNTYNEFISHRGDTLFSQQFASAGSNAEVGVNCSQFIIPDGYPITFGHSRFANQIESSRPWSTLTDKRIVDTSINGLSNEIIRGYDDGVYADIYNNAKGEVKVNCNIYIGKLFSEIFKAILDYYGGQNLPKIAPCLCVVSSVIRTTTNGWGHRTGKAIDFDYYHNYEGRGKLLWDGRNSNYKGFLDIIRASGCSWPIRDIGGGPMDYMHFQWR